MSQDPDKLRERWEAAAGGRYTHLLECRANVVGHPSDKRQVTTYVAMNSGPLPVDQNLRKIFEKNMEAIGHILVEVYDLTVPLQHQAPA